MIGIKAVWFILHVCCQWTGVSLFVASFALAVSKLHGKTLNSKVYEAHKVQGLGDLGSSKVYEAHKVQGSGSRKVYEAQSYRV